MSTTSLVARQCRLREWSQMIRDCQNRPENMSVDEWCEAHSLTKANYYYRMTQVRKACLETVPKEVVEQAVVPIPLNLMTIEEQGISETEADSFLELESNGAFTVEMRVFRVFSSIFSHYDWSVFNELHSFLEVNNISSHFPLRQA